MVQEDGACGQTGLALHSASAAYWLPSHGPVG